MPEPATLPESFYLAPATEVARRMLGMRLVRLLDGTRVSGRIIEAEAYLGEEDLACHARSGRTPRTEVMYGPPGRAYVYFTYGMHWMLNCVCGPEGEPAAVLIRAIQPLEGIDTIASRRTGVAEPLWCNGPGKLTRALAIDGTLNGSSLCVARGHLWLEAGDEVPEHMVLSSPRVGIQNTPEPWRSIPWRYRITSPAS